MPDPLGSGANYLAMLASSNQRRVVRVDVHGSDGNFIVTIPDVVSGSVQADTTAAVRRTCTLVIADRGLVADVANSMVPYIVVEANDIDKDNIPLPGNQWGTLLHPLSGNELRIYRGFEYADGTSDYVPLGVFRMTKPHIADAGTDIQITITGNDRSWMISRYKWTQPFQVNAGMLLEEAVIAILNDRWQGDIPLDTSLIGSTISSMNPSGILLPTQTFGADLASSNDPWADLQSLVTPVGMQLYFDTSGRPVMEPIVNPTQIAPVFSGSYEEGATCTLTDLEYDLDETNTYSGVIAIGNGTGNNLPPVTSMSVSPTNGQTYVGVWNTDPDSPTYYDPGNPDASENGDIPYIFETQTIPSASDTAESAQFNINAAAYAQLQLVMSAYKAPTLKAVPNPALWENDLISIVRARIGFNENFLVQAVTIPLDVTTEMEVTLKPQATPAGN